MWVEQGNNNLAIVSTMRMSESSVKINSLPEGDGRLMFDGENLYREPSTTPQVVTNNYSLAAALTD